MIKAGTALFILQTPSGANNTLRMLFVIAVLVTVLWWAVQKLVGRERGNEIMLHGAWRLLKALVLLPFKILGFIFRLIFSDKNK